jgi:hydrogenase/urease accessory protein HupE
MGSFWAGVAHSLTSLDQLCFLLGQAIWTRFHAPSLDARVIAAVFGAAIAGVFAAAPFAGTTHLDLAGPIAAIMILVGIGGAARLRIDAVALLGIAALGSMFCGAAAEEGAAGLSLAPFSLGASVAGAAVLSYGLLGTRLVRAEWGTIALRAGSSWIGAIGLMILALTVARHLGRA